MTFVLRQIDGTSYYNEGLFVQLLGTVLGIPPPCDAGIPQKCDGVRQLQVYDRETNLGSGLTTVKLVILDGPTVLGADAVDDVRDMALYVLPAACMRRQACSPDHRPVAPLAAAPTTRA